MGTGQTGEDLAVCYLENQGYTIVERNYRKRIGEIDIIARDGECLVFIEVKTRTNRRFGSPFDAVDFRKQQQISRVALAFMTQHRCGEVPVRFDVIGVHLEESPRVELIKNAFEYCD
ncbi:MAG: YraN family protein [Deltaproteobacteria bacterium]|nr:YraN family protein [Deltaproteobacteria bacterium]